MNGEGPVDMDAERGTLGGMLLLTRAVTDAIEVVRGADFSEARHRLIFDAVLALYVHGEPTDTVAVADQLLKTGLLEEAGGSAYLHELTSSAGVPASVSFHAMIVAEKAMLRRLAQVAGRIERAARHGDADARDLLAWAAGEVLGVTGPARPDDAVPLPVAIDMAVELVESLCGSDGAIAEVRTGIVELDALTGGLRPGELVVIAGLTGAGKTMLALDIARHAAIEQERPVLLFSLELSSGEIGARLLSAESGVPLDDLRSGRVDPRAWTAIAGARMRVRERSLLIDDRTTLSVDDMRLAGHQMMNRGGVKLIVVDHVQLLQDPAVSRQLKMLARELRVPVVAVSQLVDGTVTPALSAVPGAVANDADVVVLVDGGSLVVAKHRHGPLAALTVDRQPHLMRFRSS